MTAANIILKILAVPAAVVLTVIYHIVDFLSGFFLKICGFVSVVLCLLAAYFLITGDTTVKEQVTFWVTGGVIFILPFVVLYLNKYIGRFGKRLRDFIRY